MEQYPGIMKNHIDTGEFIEGRNEGLYFPVIEGLKYVFPRTGWDMAGNSQYKTDFLHGMIPDSF
jgi:hypothetical protein